MTDKVDLQKVASRVLDDLVRDRGIETVSKDLDIPVEILRMYAQRKASVDPSEVERVLDYAQEAKNGSE